MTHRHKLLTIFLLLMLAAPVIAQDDLSPYDIALLRIESSRANGAVELHITGLGLTELPPEIGQLSNLQRLYLFENRLRELPPEIGNLVNLQSLQLNNNQLTELPPEIGNLVNLNYLSLISNQLTELPPEIGNLINLQFLSLVSNQLTELPPEIGNLVNLQGLQLNNNRLSDLPLTMGYLTNLQYFEMGDNPLTFPPPEIVRLGTRTTFAYLRDEYEKQQAEIKRLIVMSASGVGLIVAIMLGFRLRQQGRKSKKKRDDS